MIYSPIKLLVWNLLSFVSALPLGNYIEPNNKNWTGNVDFEARLRELFLPETEAINHGLLPPNSEVGQLARSKRDLEVEDFGLDNVSFEVPTIMRVKDSHNEDARVKLSPLESEQPAAFVQGNPMQCRPKPNSMPKQPPITINLCIDNIIPPGKAEKFTVTNTSEIRGCALMMKINLFEKKSTSANPSNCNPSDLVFSFDITGPTTMSDRLETQNKKKSDEEEEEEDSSDQKVIQEVLRKILAGKLNSTTVPPEELPAFLRNSSKEPFTLILNPSLLRKLSTKLESTTSHWPTAFTYRSPNPPDYDYLYKVVEQLSSSISKQKLTSLLSSLIAKAYPSEK